MFAMSIASGYRRVRSGCGTIEDLVAAWEVSERRAERRAASPELSGINIL